ncbi:MAG TPA: GH116 family glycosyl-hydrolase [Caldilineaceae bacterium]|nr:GH116 family glycosyl-hydrolase [Caldilineaceae bacterium]
MDHFLYRGAKTSQISFPLGGIGSGSIGLAGNGRLIDWEIFNRPNKGSVNGFSHFAIRAEDEGKVVAARICHGDLLPPYQGEFTGGQFRSFGWGPRREYLTGLPHFPSVDFRGEYPLAELTFHDESFPGQVVLRAFNPLIPTNDKDSSIPAAFFELKVANPTDRPLTYTLVGVLGNPLPANNLNTVEEHPWGHALHLRSDSLDPKATAYGDLTLATDAKHEPDVQVSWQQYWFRGAWFDNLEVYWHDLMRPGPFQNRVYPPDQAGAANEGLLAVHVPVAPGASRQVRFVITWNFPNCENYWKPAPKDETGAPRGWRNYYATVWPDSLASAEYALREWSRLLDETERFHHALFSSDIPPAALDAVSANISILKSPTVLRLEDGTFYGWEGCHPNAGCCEGSCTHVWNYAQALPFLFPRLERSMREADYTYNLRPDGGMPFRLQLPLGVGWWAFRPCCDGQFGGVMKTYRDWKVCGDTEWLRRLWPAVKQSLEFAWSPDNTDRWDPDKTGVLWGRQHHTLDMELFGPNSWLTTMYLGALKAAAEMAEALGEPETAAEYRAIFARGRAWVDANLFNGEYYIQRIDLKDRSIIEGYEDDAVIQGGSALNAYWTAEHGEIKYQIGEGSSIDQVLGQWHASLYGLGDLLDPAQVRQANAAIYKYNYVPIMRNAYNPDRIYCLNDEGGLVICAWPEGAQKPVIPAPYSQETFHGCEYAAASHMIMTGLVEEGMVCVEAVRRRYDGERRNPWNEFECGSNYARSMASYALLNAFSGFQFDLVHHRIGFHPQRMHDGHFRCFWSLDPGWGEFVLTPDLAELRVLYGALPVQTLALPFLGERAVGQVLVDGTPVAFTRTGEGVQLEAPVRLAAGQTLQVAVG